MAEYIEREPLLEDLKTAIKYGSTDETTVKAALMHYIKHLPTADVAPVVYCKDCKYSDAMEDGGRYCHRLGGVCRDVDDYCSRGKRKDADNV